MSKYLEFALLEKKPKTQVIKVMSKIHGNSLGVIKWFGRWRQYSFFPEPETVFNVECLNDIKSYILRLKSYKRYITVSNLKSKEFEIK